MSSNTHRLREGDLSLLAGKLRETVMLPEGLFGYTHEWGDHSSAVGLLDISSTWKIAPVLLKGSIPICSSSGEA